MKPLFITFVLLMSQLVFSRPEYAAKHAYVNCNLCHSSPFGGGARNLNGKFYGSHEYKVGPFSKQEMFSFDARFEGFYQKGASTTRGLLFMTADPSLNVPVVEDEDGNVTDRILFGLGVSPMEKSNYFNREGMYVHYFAQPGTPRFFSSLVLGRFNLPFGLMTEEHRTYVRLQTRTTNFDYDIGFGLTGDPTDRLHWDLTMTGGTYTTGGATPVNNDSPYAIVANLRWKPGFHPGFIGTSFYTQNSQTLSQPVEAFSIYSVISLENMFKRRVNWQIEFAQAEGFNDEGVNTYVKKFFISDADTAWYDIVKEATSMGFYSLLNYELSSKSIIQWKYEQFIPDKEFTADSFSRNGFGFKYFLNSNSDISFRVEQSNSTRPEVTEKGAVTAVNNAGFILFHGWF